MEINSYHINKKVEVLSLIENQSFSSEWYETSSENHFWFEWRKRALFNIAHHLKIDKTKPLKVLDIGSGQGLLRDQLEKQTAWIVDCVDLDMKALEESKDGRGRTIYYNIFDEDEKMLEKYDLVFIFDVIEHLQSPQDFLISGLKYLKPDGLILINVPAYQSCYSLYDKAIGHLFRYNKSSLKQLFQNLPINIISVSYWGMLLLPLLIVRKYLLKFFPKSKEDIIRSGFKPPSEFANKILKLISILETSLTKSTPMGTSVLLIGQKREVSCHQ